MLGAKRLELLREIMPNVAVVGIISNPQNQNAKDHLRELDEAARAIGQKTVILSASNEAEIAAAFAALGRHDFGAALVADDPYFNVRRDQFVSLATRHGIPTVYYASEFAQAGGLISYGPSVKENYRLGAGYVGKILKGAKPADLPVLQPTTFELVINLKTAHALGIKIPNSILLRAEKVIK
jgi:putative ABC transport system substrate-binding protein